MDQFPHKFNRNDVLIDKIETAFQGFFRLDKVTFRHPLFAGGISPSTTREVFERGDAVVVLAYDRQQDKLVLVEQIRIPALRTAANPWQLELVAGIVEAGETPAEVAQRELLEESGLTAQSLKQICSYLPSPGGCSERHTLFLALVELPQDQQQMQVFGLGSENEDIRRHIVSREQALQLLEQGAIDNAPTILGLQWLALHYLRL
ncbi:NUDIX domain-containing protein [Ferrimonas senticii]|uniref:NUDIX domain-containing protein n=1 Tax=Ferrimonas senticii TaxID=394566 RepID=UPI0003F7BC8E|nr:NUDIX domain-containing protein [Ferrimonas senticii]